MGGALAVVWTNRQHQVVLQVWSKRLLPIALALLAWTLIRGFGPSQPEGHPRYFTIWGYTWIALAFAIVMVVALDNRHVLASLLANHVLRSVGKVSYGLYVWHCCVGVAVRNALNHVGWRCHLDAAILVWVSASLGMAYLSWVLLERPLLQLKRLFICQPSAFTQPAESV
jgi:peptidoglycan/LPS O-acetylase OafA/YrhL